MSADPQLLSKEHAQEQEELDDSTPFATEPDRSGVSTSAFAVRGDTTAGRDEAMLPCDVFHQLSTQRRQSGVLVCALSEVVDTDDVH